MYQIYDPVTGRIKYSAEVEPDIAEYMRDNGEALVEGDGGDITHYVDISVTPLKIMLRPTQETRQDKTHITPDGEDVVTLSGLPVPCCVMVDENEYEVNDGLFEWGTRRAGEYALRVVAFPFLDWEGAVTAV